MESALQIGLVAVIVTAAVIVAFWRLAPARLKLRMLDWFAPDTAHVWGRWIARLRKGVAAELTHGCGSCSQASTRVHKPRAG